MPARKSAMVNAISRLQKVCAWGGNLLEHYDVALFGFLSPFLAPLIFPDKEPITALILTYAMIPLGKLARPLGALVFGVIGDRYGRAFALYLTLGGMGVVSLCIAASPTYAQVGVIAPMLFCVGRIFQNFLGAGTSTGNALLLLENSLEHRRDLVSSFYNCSTIAGIFFASLGVVTLCYFDICSWGWRLLYLVGALTALCGWMMRKQEVVLLQKTSLRSLLHPCWVHRKALLLVMLGMGFSSANYMMSLVLMNGFVPLVTVFSKEKMMSLNTWLLILDCCAMPFFGYLASRIGRKQVMVGSALGVALLAIPLCVCLEGASLSVVIAVRSCFVLLGVAFAAPCHAWSYGLVPAQHRYTILSLGSALGSQLFGSPAAAFSLWCFKTTLEVPSIALYWLGLAAATSFALAFSKVPKEEVFQLQKA